MAGFPTRTGQDTNRKVHIGASQLPYLRPESPAVGISLGLILLWKEGQRVGTGGEVGLSGSQEPILPGTTSGFFFLLNEQANIVLHSQCNHLGKIPQMGLQRYFFLPQISLGRFGKGRERRGVI